MFWLIVMGAGFAIIGYGTILIRFVKRPARELSAEHQALVKSFPRDRYGNCQVDIEYRDGRIRRGVPIVQGRWIGIRYPFPERAPRTEEIASIAYHDKRRASA